MSNNLANEIAVKVALLPVEKQREVLQMVESLVENITHRSQPQRRRLLGSLEHLNIKWQCCKPWSCV